MSTSTRPSPVSNAVTFANEGRNADPLAEHGQLAGESHRMVVLYRLLALPQAVGEFEQLRGRSPRPVVQLFLPASRALSTRSPDRRAQVDARR